MAKKHKKSKFKIGYVVLGIVIAALILVGAVAYNNRHNIQALYAARKSSSEEISVKQEQNRQRTQEILDSLTDADIKELPEEVREKLQTGEITEEESLDIILGKTTVDEVMENHSSGNGDGQVTDSAKEEPSQNVSTESRPGNKPAEDKPRESSSKEEIIAKIYLLRAEYLNKIDAFIESGKATIRALPPGSWSMSTKMSLINQFASQGNALEASCDARMEQLLGELEAELIRNGESTAPIGEIRGAYAEQKQLKKEELFNTYYPD